MKWLAIFVALSLSGCVTTRDQVGNVYPEPCRGELVCTGNSCTMGGKQFLIQTVSPREMPKNKNGRAYLGWHNYGSGMSLISTESPNRIDTVRHEGCHALVGRWHPE